MEYEIVNLESKTFAGVCATTSNGADDMMTKIGGLWQSFCSGIWQKMSGLANRKNVGLYCDYGKTAKDSYIVLVGAEVTKEGADKAEKAGLCVKSVPAGKYAKFTVKGSVSVAVGKAWEEIWKTPLDRTFTGDFEEYQEDGDGKNGTIFIYVAVK